MSKRQDHHLYRNGRWTGWNEFRYGVLAKPMSLSKLKPVLRVGERKQIGAKVFALVEDWRSSPFEHEGACRHGLRRALCLAGHSWRVSDHEAQTIVDTAIQRLGFERPSFEEGQPDWSGGTDYCSWCHGPMELEGMSRKQRFCSAECASMAVTHRNRASAAYEGVVLRSAYRLIAKAKAPPKDCMYCGGSFQSDREEAMFCSNKCGSRWSKGDLLLKDIVCEGCGKTTKPSNRGAKFCSLTCRSVTLWTRERERLSVVTRECQCCRIDFTPGAEKSIYCSPRCASTMASRAYLERNRKPKTMHHFNCQCCGEGFATHIPWSKFCSRSCASMVKRWDAGKVRWLTPSSFDYMLRRGGARITEVRREAA